MWLKELDLVEICPPQKKGNGGGRKKTAPPYLIFLIFKDSDFSRQFVGSSLYSHSVSYRPPLSS